MTIVDEALNIAEGLCCVFEGCFLSPYLCPAHVPTIGIGSTLYADGRKVSMDDPDITKAQAVEMLRVTLRRDYLAGVVKASPGLLSSAPRLAAIVDFAYNCGVPRYRASTLRKRIDAGDWSGAREEIMKWNKGGGRVLAGLTKRRAAEAALL